MVPNHECVISEPGFFPPHLGTPNMNFNSAGKHSSTYSATPPAPKVERRRLHNHPRLLPSSPSSLACSLAPPPLLAGFGTRPSLSLCAPGLLGEMVSPERELRGALLGPFLYPPPTRPVAWVHGGVISVISQCSLTEEDISALSNGAVVMEIASVCSERT